MWVSAGMRPGKSSLPCALLPAAEEGEPRTLAKLFRINVRKRSSVDRETTGSQMQPLTDLMTSLQIVNRCASNSGTRFIQCDCQQAEDMSERVTSTKWQSGLFPSNILKPSLWFGLDEILRTVPLLPGNSPFHLFFKKFLLGGAFAETRKCKRHNAGMNTCIKMSSGNGIKAGGGFEKKYVTDTLRVYLHADFRHSCDSTNSITTWSCWRAPLLLSKELSISHNQIHVFDFPAEQLMHSARSQLSYLSFSSADASNELPLNASLHIWHLRKK